MPPLTPPRPLLIPVWVVHRLAYRLSGGRIGGRMQGLATLLLRTVGRRTGRERHTPLYYLEDGENLVVVASNGGSDRDPEWWLNLQASPETDVWLGPARRRVRARRAGAEETRRLWPRLVALYAGYDEYSRRAAREIPVVILEPLA